MSTIGPGHSPKLLCFLLLCSIARWPPRPAYRPSGPGRRLFYFPRCCSGSGRRSMPQSALPGRPLMLSPKPRIASMQPLLQLAQQQQDPVMTLPAALITGPAMANNIQVHEFAAISNRQHRVEQRNVRVFTVWHQYDIRQ